MFPPAVQEIKKYKITGGGAAITSIQRQMAMS